MISRWGLAGISIITRFQRLANRRLDVRHVGAAFAMYGVSFRWGKKG
jgi:hypothetical protein